MILVKNSDLEKVKFLFNDIRFYMSNSVLDGLMGQAYVDDMDNPRFSYLLVKKYCFMSGKISETKLKEVILSNELRKYKIIPSDDLKNKIETVFKNEIQKHERYSIKKSPKFNKESLENYIKNLDTKYKIVIIDDNLSRKIIESNFINITDNFKEKGIGVCCKYNDEIIGVASSNIIYNDGIEVNIKVDDKFRREGIATAMASKLILLCLECGKKISWDAANIESLGLAKKLGFLYDSTYNIYSFNNL